MRILAIDPGALRLGFAVLEEGAKNKPPKYVASGIYGLERGGNKSKPEPFQQYRLRLIDFWIQAAPKLFESHTPDLVVGEIVPAVGGGNFRAATQSQLAETAITVVFVVAKQNGIPVEQIGATSAKRRIGGSKTATKVKVRNGVFKLMPETERYRVAWKRVFDTSDAFAIALTYLGYDICDV